MHVEVARETEWELTITAVVGTNEDGDDLLLNCSEYMFLSSSFSLNEMMMR